MGMKYLAQAVVRIINVAALSYVNMARLNYVSEKSLLWMCLVGMGHKKHVFDRFAGWKWNNVRAGTLVAHTGRHCCYLLAYLIGTRQQLPSWGSSIKFSASWATCVFSSVTKVPGFFRQDVYIIKTRGGYHWQGFQSVPTLVGPRLYLLTPTFYLTFLFWWPAYGLQAPASDKRLTEIVWPAPTIV